MDFTLTQDFPAGLDALWATFGQPDYPLAKYRALGASAVRVHRFEATAQAITVELERDVAVDRARLPAWTHRLLGDVQTLRHRSLWRRVGPKQVQAELEISPRRLPVRALAVGLIAETAPSSTRLRLSWQVRSVLGAKVERLFADQIQAAMADDHRYTLRCLQGQPPPS